MAYRRYENGDRVPSYQTIQYMAEILGTSYDYLCCMTDDPAPDTLIIKKDLDPVLFEITKSMEDKDSELRKRLIAYYKGLQDLQV